MWFGMHLKYVNLGQFVQFLLCKWSLGDYYNDKSLRDIDDGEKDEHGKFLVSIKKNNSMNLSWMWW